MIRSRRSVLKLTGALGAAGLSGYALSGSAAARSYSIDSDLRRTVDITGGQLDGAVDAVSPGSPLVGLGDTWTTVQSDRNINAVYMAAHAALESAWGRSSIAQNMNNIYGFRAYDICPSECANGYDSFAQCTREVMAYVDAEYLTQGGDWYEGTTLRAMNVNYATDDRWAEKIASIMNSLNAELPAPEGGGGSGGGGGGDGDSGGSFSDGDRVTPTTGLNTRHRPGTDSEVLATYSSGTVGEIMNGPTNKNGYTWWGVHWLDDDVWGWSVEKYLEQA